MTNNVSRRLLPLLVVVAAACTGDGRATGVYGATAAAIDPLLLAQLAGLSPVITAPVDAAARPGRGVPSAGAAVAADDVVEVRLHGDRTVGLLTPVDEFFCCGTWSQSGADVQLLLELVDPPLRLDATLRGDVLEVAMPRGATTAPLRLQRRR